MSRRYDLVVFDWDGTVMDSTGLIVECIQAAARDLALEAPSPEHARSIIGLGVNDSIKRLFPALDAAGQLQFALAYRRRFVARDHEAPVYAGIHELLRSLTAPERFLAVATGKPRAGLERAFSHSGLREFFQYSRCADEGFPKPHPDMLLKLMEFTLVPPERTLMIGDTTHDLEFARNAGADAVAVAYGAHPRAALAGYSAHAIFDDVSELAAWMNRNA